MANWDKVSSDIERGPWGLGKWIIITLIFFAVVFGVLRSVGLVGGTAVERAVFENSFQYKAGQEARGAILEANLIEVRGQLSIATDPDQRAALQAQERAIQAQLRAVTPSITKRLL